MTSPDLLALQEALDAASRSITCADAGRHEESRRALADASLAACGAFPPGSPQSGALSLILRTVAAAAPPARPAALTA